MNKRVAKAVVGWIENSMLDADKISDYFRLTGKERQKVRELTQRIRRKKYPKLYEEAECQLQSSQE